MSQRKKRTEPKTSAQPAGAVPRRPRVHATREAALVLVAAVLLAGAVWGVYGRAVDAPFIFDDKESILTNASIRNFLPLVGNAGQPGLLSPPPTCPVAGRPLVNLSLAANYFFGQLNPAGYHVFNIWLHVFSAVLLFAIVRRTLRLPYFGGRFDRAADPVAVAAAMLWAVHPLQTESIIYVTQRTELMVGFCYLATLYGSLRYWAATTQSGRATWLALAVLASLAGMASKEVMVTAPVVVLLFERTFIARSFSTAWRQSWPLYVGLAATWVLLLALNVGGPRSAAAGFHLGVPAYAWWFTQAKVFLMYLKLVVWPWPLAIHYEMPYLNTVGAAWPWLLGVALLVSGILILLWRNHPVGFLGAWVLLILSPTSIVPIVTEVAAERRMYLPLAALVVLLIVGGYWLVRQMARWLREEGQTEVRRWLLAAAGCLFVAVVLVSSVVSARRLDVFQDALVLWQVTVASQPDDALAHYNLGNELTERGQAAEAIWHYRRAIELNPVYAAAHNNLGNQLARAGQTKQAIACYQRALQFKPNYAAAHYNLGMVLEHVGQRQQAVDHYWEVLKLKPDHASAHYRLGVFLRDTGQTSQAIEHLERTVQLRPDDAEAHASLGYLLADAGRLPEAVTHFEQASKLKPADPKIVYSWASSLLRAGRVEEAVEQFRHALQLNPDYVEAHNNLAAALASAGQFDKAIEHCRRVVELDPNSTEARNNLAILLFKSGRFPEAIAEFRASLQLNSNLWNTHENLAGVLKQTGKLDEAIEHYRQAVRLNPESAVLHAHLAEALSEIDQPAEAIAAAQQAVDLARSQGQSALVDKIEAWLARYRAGLAKEHDASPTSNDEPPSP
jgi:tetratricopeptide (TPR) repeat protein